MSSIEGPFSEVSDTAASESISRCPLLQVEDCLWDYLLSLHSGNEQRAVEDAYNLQVTRVM